MDKTIFELFENSSHKELITWAQDCAYHVLSFFEELNPKDLRPRESIESIEKWKNNELTVLEALKRKPFFGIEKNFLTVLKYIIEQFSCVKIYDPANTNNIVSDTITDNQKLQIIQMASSSHESDCCVFRSIRTAIPKASGH